MSDILLNPYTIAVFCFSCCTGVSWGLQTIRDSNPDGGTPQPISVSVVVLPDFPGPQFWFFCFVLFVCLFFICRSWKLDYWSLKSLSSKISSCFVHYLHPFPCLSLLPLTHPLSSVTFTGFIITGWTAYFPHWAMRPRVSACGFALWLCGARCWSYFTRCCCWREGIWLFNFTVLAWPAAITTLSDASIWRAGERLMEEAHQTQLFGSVSSNGYLVRSGWSSHSPGSLHMSGPMTCEDLRRRTWKRTFNSLHSLDSLADVHWGVLPIISL